MSHHTIPVKQTPLIPVIICKPSIIHLCCYFWVGVTQKRNLIRFVKSMVRFGVRGQFSLKQWWLRSQLLHHQNFWAQSRPVFVCLKVLSWSGCHQVHNKSGKCVTCSVLQTALIGWLYTSISQFRSELINLCYILKENSKYIKCMVGLH